MKEPWEQEILDDINNAINAYNAGRDEKKKQKLIDAENAKIAGIVESVTFKGVHYEMVIEAYDFSWLVHSTKAAEVGSTVGISFDPYDIHIMKKMGDKK